MVILSCLLLEQICSVPLEGRSDGGADLRAALENTYDCISLYIYIYGANIIAMHQINL